jgi:branched-chain amino acid transport system permease protein
MDTIILQVLITGILMGGVYGLIALSLNLVFGVIKVINFAHGEFLMIGMYASFFLVLYTGLSPYLAIPVIVIFLFFVGSLAFILVIKPTLKAQEMNQILLTMGLSIFLQNVALYLFRSDLRQLSLPIAAKTFIIGSYFIEIPKLLAFFISLGTALVLYLFLQKTALGRSIRAVADNREAAELMGLNVNRIYMVAFAIGISCLGVAGPILLPFFYTSPTVGGLFTLTAFIIVVLGTLGSFGGALIGGLIVGVGESFGSLFLPGSTGPLAIYIIFILTLLFKPEGLFGRRLN